MVGALDSESSGLGLILALLEVVCCVPGQYTSLWLAVPLSTQVYEIMVNSKIYVTSAIIGTETGNKCAYNGNKLLIVSPVEDYFLQNHMGIQYHNQAIMHCTYSSTLYIHFSFPTFSEDFPPTVDLTSWSSPKPSSMSSSVRFRHSWISGSLRRCWSTSYSNY